MRETVTRPRYAPGPTRGDERRAALLKALDELLETRPLAELGIADITRAAGVTRSAFYFYFPSKGAAVAALLADFDIEMMAAAAAWYDGGPGTPLERLRGGFEASVSRWRTRAGLMVAMRDAVGADATVRDLWERWVDGFVERAAERIAEDRASGLARESVDAHALATALVGAAFSAMERDVRAIHAGASPSDHVAPALIEIWHRAIYEDG
jgi:AcrR family transcriptional regulator